MPTPFPKEFQADVIAVARKGNQSVAHHVMSRRSFGSPRVHAELRLGQGLQVGR